MFRNVSKDKKWYFKWILKIVGIIFFGESLHYNIDWLSVIVPHNSLVHEI